MVKRLVNSIGVSEAILFEFFIVFSRFEFALKACNYVRSGRSGSAEPDWDKFILCISKESNDDLTYILDIGRYIIKNPPKKLIIAGGKLRWNDVTIDNINNIVFLINGIRRVRNNLFHGSKFDIHNVNINSRNEKLISCSLSVLRAILRLPVATNIYDTFYYSEITEEFHPSHGLGLSLPASPI